METNKTAKKGSIDLKALLARVKQFTKKVSKHVSFLAIMAVLLSYVLVVWQISRLIDAEPGDDTTSSVSSSIPKIDKNAINQIQSLEQNNTQVHALFNQARNNPFQE